MSTKIYDVYKFVGNGKKEPTLLDVYKFLQPIKKEVVRFYENLALEDRVIELHKEVFKVNRNQKSEFEMKFGGMSYEAVTENCVVYTHKTGLYVHFFLGHHFRELRNKISRSKLLQDYHYQNSTDRPKDISEKDWNKRKKLWDEIIGHDTPANSGFIYDFMTYLEFELILTRNAWRKADERRSQQKELDNGRNWPDEPKKESTNV